MGTFGGHHLAMGQNPVPPMNIPIPTKIGSKMGGAPKTLPLVLTHGHLGGDSGTPHLWDPRSLHSELGPSESRAETSSRARKKRVTAFPEIRGLGRRNSDLEAGFGVWGFREASNCLLRCPIWFEEETRGFHERSWSFELFRWPTHRASNWIPWHPRRIVVPETVGESQQKQESLGAWSLDCSPKR